MGNEEDIALLYGIFAGDGCLSYSQERYFLSLTCNFYDDKPFFDNIVVPLFERIRSKTTIYRERQDQGKLEFNFTDKNLFELLKNIGFPVGKKGNKLFIPDCLLKEMKLIIAGYFATDGSIVLAHNNGIIYPRIEIQGLSKQILVQICEFLNNHGMKGYVYEIRRKKSIRQIAYHLQFNGFENAVIFERLIGFINPKHKVKFENFIKSRSSSSVERHTPD